MHTYIKKKINLRTERTNYRAQKRYVFIQIARILQLTISHSILTTRNVFIESSHISYVQRLYNWFSCNCKTFSKGMHVVTVLFSTTNQCAFIRIRPTRRISFSKTQWKKKKKMNKPIPVCFLTNTVLDDSIIPPPFIIYKMF